MTRILCITHAPFEPPGAIETWAHERSYPFEIISPYRGQTAPAPRTFDFLIIMGGPQSPFAMEDFSYLKDEIALVRAALALNKRILGICLGAQLVGEALGASTLRSPEKEVGVFPITLTSAGLVDPLFRGLPESLPALHWHNDMPGLVDGAKVLGFSAGCPHQIVRYKPLVYGLQCHFEFTLEGIRTIAEAVPDDLRPSKFVQDQQTLFSHDFATLTRTMYQILDRFVFLNSMSETGHQHLPSVDPEFSAPDR